MPPRRDNSSTLRRILGQEDESPDFFFYLFLPIGYVVMTILAAVLKGFIEEGISFLKYGDQDKLLTVTTLMISAGVFGVILCVFALILRNSTSSNCHVFMFLFYSCVLVLQIATVVCGFIQITDRNQVMKKNIYDDLIHSFENTFIQESFNTLEMEKSCCGVYNVNDYTKSDRSIPKTCCAITENQDQACTVTSAYKDGCAPKMYDDIIYNLRVMTYTTIGFIIFQIIPGLLTCFYRNRSGYRSL